MTGKEIHELMELNNDRIAQLLDPAQFTLNKEVEELISHNRHLQSICPHEFENGTCIYCYSKEKGE